MKSIFGIFSIIISFYSWNQTIIELPNYDDISQFRSGYSYVTMNGKAGIIDSNFKEIIPLEFEYIDCYDSGPFVFNDTIFAVKNNKTFLFNSEGRLLDSLENVKRPNELHNWSKRVTQIKNLNCYSKANNWWSQFGCTRNDSIIIPFNYQRIIEGLSNNQIIAFLKDSVHIYSVCGQLVKKMPRSNFSINRTDSIYTFFNEKKIVIADKNFKILRKINFEAVQSNNDSFYSVKLNGHYGVVNNRLDPIIPFVFDEIYLGNYFIFCVRNKKCQIFFRSTSKFHSDSFDMPWYELYSDSKLLVIPCEGGKMIIDENGVIVAKQEL